MPRKKVIVTPWSPDLQLQGFQLCDTSIAVYATTYQYHLTFICFIKSALAFWRKKVLHILKAVANQAKYLSTSLLQDYLQINPFSIPVLVEQKL